MLVSKIIGIDGGKTGGICLIDTLGEVVEAFPMPMLKGKIPQYDLLMIMDFFQRNKDAFVVIEKAIILGPLTSKQAAQSTGWCVGFLEGLCNAYGMRYQVVPPQAWQKVIFEGLNWKKDSKVFSAIYAQRMAPKVDWKLGPKKKATGLKSVHDGMTDAFCLAEYGRRFLRQI